MWRRFVVNDLNDANQRVARPGALTSFYKNNDISRPALNLTGRSWSESLSPSTLPLFLSLPPSLTLPLCVSAQVQVGDVYSEWRFFHSSIHHGWHRSLRLI